MFLTTGAPVLHQVEGKLYPLSHQPAPGMVKKIAYSLWTGPDARFERDLELNMARKSLADAGRFPRQRVQAARRSRVWSSAPSAA